MRNMSKTTIFQSEEQLKEIWGKQSRKRLVSFLVICLVNANNLHNKKYASGGHLYLVNIINDHCTEDERREVWDEFEKLRGEVK